MIKLKGHKFKLQKGDYLRFKKRKVTFNNMVKSYIGVVRAYDGLNSQSGVLSTAYVIYHLSGEIKEVTSPHVFAWYKEGFFLLRDLETGSYSSLIDDDCDLYRMNKKEIQRFKIRIIKNKILINLK